MLASGLLADRFDRIGRGRGHPGSLGAARDFRRTWPHRPKKAPPPPPPRAQPAVWPRLDPGAVLAAPRTTSIATPPT